jgi:hypothetical protein
MRNTVTRRVDDASPIHLSDLTVDENNVSYAPRSTLHLAPLADADYLPATVYLGAAGQSDCQDAVATCAIPYRVGWMTLYPSTMANHDDLVVDEKTSATRPDPPCI